MIVREAIKLISYESDWKLIGARTGKKLCNSFSREKTKEKYMELTVTDAPFVADFSIGKSISINTYARPIISIWVSGQ